ncbi:dienelactone hydrolase family protein [Dyella sp. 20L07]|uniref:carboxylesterase family protein n=1 Tax=Dyella sp. 20L07 TaxID=3384240 RepID=UPI003D2E49F3
MKIRRFLALLAYALVAGCSANVVQNEPVRGVKPLGRDVFSSVSADQFQSGQFQASDGTIVHYRLLAPSHLKAGITYPLVLQLHGSGGIGDDNVSQLDRLAKSWAMPEVRERYQAFVLVPQFPIRSANYGPAAPDQKSVPSKALNSVVELVRDFSAHHPVDRSRTYAVGFSMGGSAAWLAPTLDRSLFAAIVPMSGVAPDDSLASIYRNLPILVIHGDSDEENPITSDRRFYESIKGVGGRKITLRVYEGIDHQLPGDIYPGFWWRDWLFEQARK